MRQIPLGNHLGDYLREQRQSARLSLRQLADLAGISNPYLSQIERGLKKPSAEILQQLAKGLQVSAESLYVRAGILDERPPVEPPATDTRAVIAADPQLTERQKATLLDVYDSFVGAVSAAEESARGGSAPKPARTSRTSRTSRSGKGSRSAKSGKPAKANKPAVSTTAKAATTPSDKSPTSSTEKE